LAADKLQLIFGEMYGIIYRIDAGSIGTVPEEKQEVCAL
jgi:hypothetical protein